MLLSKLIFSTLGGGEVNGASAYTIREKGRESKGG
jgi:hypothetical protein